MQSDETLYEHAGGDEALHRLEELFYAKALADPILKHVFTEHVATHVDHLTWFTAESFGGPPRFTSGLGFKHIIDVHRGLKITRRAARPIRGPRPGRARRSRLTQRRTFRQAFREHIEFGAHVADRTW
jgi:hemoglobin